jgi:hypothetical protein
MQRSALVRLFGLVLGVVVAVGAGCNFAGQPCGLLNVSACDSQSTDSGAGGNLCAGLGGAGGFGGDGAGGFGGSDVGTSVGGSDVGVGAGVGGSFGVGAGVGGSFGDAVGASVGAGAGDAWSSGDEGHVARAPLRHRGRRRGIGTARQAGCSGQPQQNYIPPPPSRMPNWQPLTTTILRSIAIANNINGCAGQTGITQNRSIGVAFEAWVLKTMGQLPRWTTPIFSTARQKANGGLPTSLPASVIPEFVGDQTGTTVNVMPPSMTTVYFDKSVFFEVKAVTGALTLGYSKSQIRGLLDVATSYPPAVPTGPHPPPAVFFTTTGNTTVAQDVVALGNSSMVAVWQQQVLYDANSANPNNPDLSLGDEVCLTPGLYSGWLAQWIAPGPFPSNPLTWPTQQEELSVVVPGDPDPAEVD